MPKILAPDDLQEDMLVTVLVHATGRFGCDLMGVPLRVISFDLPYLYCAILEPIPSEGVPAECERGPVILDHRDLDLMELDSQVVRRFREFKGVPRKGDDPPSMPVTDQIPF